MSYKHYGARSRRNRGWLLGILIVLLLLVLACGGLFLWARSQVSGEARVMPGVTACGTDVSGMDREQVLELLRQKGYSPLEGRSLSLTLTDEVRSIPVSDLMTLPDTEAAADALLNWGHTGNLNRDAVNWLLCRVRGGGFTLAPSESELNEDALRSCCADLAEELDRQGTRTVVFADEAGLEITLGSLGMRVDQAELLSALKTALTDGSLAAEYEPEIISPETPDLDALWESYYTAPVNAKFDETYQVQPEQPGRTFDLEEARDKLSAAICGVKFSIPAIVLEPEVTAEELEGLLFRDLLASVETPLTSNEVRTHNIELAAARINDTILLPGQEFSYNGALGERTEEKGYGSASAYRDGQVVEEIGGGICQLSSAMYYCAMLADEIILERTNHRYYQSYLPLGMDATVSWGGPDFSFKLKDEYPIRMYARIENGQLKVEFWGTRLDEGHVELEYEVNAVYPHGTVYYEHKNVRSGKPVTTDYGRDGMVVTTYRVYYDGEGNLVEKVQEAVNEYSSRDAVIVVAVGERPKS